MFTYGTLTVTGVLSANEARRLRMGAPAIQVPPPPNACAQAKCEYCGRYGPLGSCEGCGAANKPVQRIEVTTHGDIVPKFIDTWG